MDFNDYFANGFESGVNKLIGRKCLECPPVKLTCPSCEDGFSCVQIQESCRQCSYRTCRPTIQTGLTPVSSTGGGPNIGAIVGGVVGGLVLIAVGTWLAWRFFIKSRREQWEQEFDEDFEEYTEKGNPSGLAPSPNPNAALSVHTRQSVASTAYTRGSNVIQIAFIPGITDRAGDNGGYIPPVPPIPAASPGPNSPQSPFADPGEDHYFMPGDLRDSTYSGFTDDGASSFHRQSAAPSIAPSLLRYSVASTIYRSESETPIPAQTAQRGRPLMVSVKSSATTSRSESAHVPAVPQIDYAKYAKPSPQNESAAQSSSGSSETIIAPQSEQTNLVIPPVSQGTSDGDTSSLAASEAPTTDSQKDIKSVIEEATRQASRQPVHGGLGSLKPDPSPFSDDHVIPNSD